MIEFMNKDFIKIFFSFIFNYTDSGQNSSNQRDYYKKENTDEQRSVWYRNVRNTKQEFNDWHKSH